mmetsp:Transcript_34799/g.92932  ORF Transcript_34799/g.92932 Transcript_34799/m.92932 type:complete len:241 (-) Transcript_34799:120-842(-)
MPSWIHAVILVLSRNVATSAEISFSSPLNLARAQPSNIVVHSSGCCFAIGYGSYMEPCCLQTSLVDDIALCKGDDVVGGSYGVNSTCPHSAAEAAIWLRARVERASPDNLMLGATELPQVAATPLPQSVGCCFEIGFGDRMAPCCLRTRMATQTECGARQRLGGASGFATVCPSSLAEAAGLLNYRIPPEEVGANLATPVSSLLVAIVVVGVLASALTIFMVRWGRRDEANLRLLAEEVE